jgi:hypothetical protein
MLGPAHGSESGSITLSEKNQPGKQTEEGDQNN